MPKLYAPFATIDAAVTRWRGERHSVEHATSTYASPPAPFPTFDSTPTLSAHRHTLAPMDERASL